MYIVTKILQSIGRMLREIEIDKENVQQPEMTNNSSLEEEQEEKQAQENLRFIGTRTLFTLNQPLDFRFPKHHAWSRKRE